MNHIHVYFNELSKPQAMSLRQMVVERFPDLTIGKTHDKPIGPHPTGNYVVLTPDERVAEVESFLKENHGGLSVLIHPVSGDDHHDHDDDHIRWIGKPVELIKAAFGPR